MGLGEINATAASETRVTPMTEGDRTLPTQRRGRRQLGCSLSIT